jgi:hypothetical protein
MGPSLLEQPEAQREQKLELRPPAHAELPADPATVKLCVGALLTTEPRLGKACPYMVNLVAFGRKHLERGKRVARAKDNSGQEQGSICSHWSSSRTQVPFSFWVSVNATSSWLLTWAGASTCTELLNEIIHGEEL